jgi:hypothetical protein
MPLINTGNVAFSYQSTAIETWLFQGPTGPRRRRRAPLRAAPRPTMGGPCVPPSLAEWRRGARAAKTAYCRAVTQ